MNEYWILYSSNDENPMMKDRNKPPKVIVLRVDGKLTITGTSQEDMVSWKSYLESSTWKSLYENEDRPLNMFIAGSLGLDMLSEVGDLDRDGQAKVEDVLQGVQDLLLKKM